LNVSFVERVKVATLKVLPEEETIASPVSKALSGAWEALDADRIDMMKRSKAVVAVSTRGAKWPDS